MSSQNGSICRFGVFELDLRNAELHKKGVKLRLSDQPYQLLVRLVQQHGGMVSREELRTTLWRADTFVNFEAGLNSAVKRLRETLGDTADNPVFIETIPRRGYRFIGTVDWQICDQPVPAVPTTPEESRHNRRHFGRIAVAVGLVALLALGLAFYWRSPPSVPVVTNIVRITNDGEAKNPLNPAVTDGVRLYFTEGMPYTTGSHLVQVATAGGETSAISTTLKDVWAVASISPYRSELLVGKGVTRNSDLDFELWVQPLPAGPAHRVGNLSAMLGNWTPDGSQIVYAGVNEISIANKDGSNSHNFANVKGVVFSLRYSPDGQKIRFDLTDPATETNEIWQMDSDGKNIHPVFSNQKELVNPGSGHWSPDGNYYYFDAGRGTDQGIWVMPERHAWFRRGPTTPTRLSSGPLHFTSPVPSSDGKRIFVLGEDRKVELLRYDEKTRRLDPYVEGLSAGPIDFSVDRKWMAYVSYPEMTLWRSRMDGSDRMQLTFPPARAYEPRWSPDGSQIVFMDVRFDVPWSLSVVQATGGPPETLLVSQSNAADPTWTLDGKSVVFGKEDEKGVPQIYSVDVKSKELSVLPNSNGLFSPRVSHDGRSICAVAANGGKLVVFDRIAGHWLTLAEGERLGYNEWSDNGKYIYFRRNRNGASELVRVNTQDHIVHPVLSLKDIPQLTDPFASWIGLTPDGAPLLMRNRSVQEIYAMDLRLP